MKVVSVLVMLAAVSLLSALCVFSLWMSIWFVREIKDVLAHWWWK